MVGEWITAVFGGNEKAGGASWSSENTPEKKPARPIYGLIGQTMVATPSDWRPVSTLRPGDRVMTFDNGFQRIESVGVTELCADDEDCPYAQWPLEVPAGYIGNRDRLCLMPQQNVIIESDLAEAQFGDPFAMVPACELDGMCGVHRIRPNETQKVYSLCFARDEVVFVNGSALVHCPNGALEGENLMVTPKASAYTPLPRDSARAVCRELAAVTGC